MFHVAIACLNDSPAVMATPSGKLLMTTGGGFAVCNFVDLADACCTDMVSIITMHDHITKTLESGMQTLLLPVAVSFVPPVLEMSRAIVFSQLS